ncbi:SH3 domain-containing protein [Massilia sp. NR 4-1]|uniref:SH3 domain-containing protein n=1 Tax=Massilia sp. NR 4-1 TaxID=1678028 RepID=UPI00067CAD7E|nr:SH3 domain-containing protein [Massilia sp. NR 4-1]AKU21417.1 hypothetical protein ACZ75_07945 [Massilia sp. NR 4-1]
MDFASYHGAFAYLAGLAMTLVLASYLTPRSWWRRPTARGLFILGAGSWALGGLLLYFFHASPLPFSSAVANASATRIQPSRPAPVPAALTAGPPAERIAAGPFYRVHRDLNLRSAASVGASRLATVPAGASVTFTGVRQGDWWQVQAKVDGNIYTGWASSLWLRKADE